MITILFPYIAIPEISGDIKKDVKALLFLNGKEKTFHHSEAVALVNTQIAGMNGLDIKLTETCGFLHDISAVIKPGDMLKYARETGMAIDAAEEKHPFLLHQRMSAILSAKLFGIKDITILSAIECHTTMKQNPSKYDMSLFVADKLSWDKEGKPPFYDIVKSSLDISLKKACLAYMDYITDNGLLLCPHRQFCEAREYLHRFINDNG